MASIMRKMNIISRSEAMYRSEKSKMNLPGIYHSYVLAICHNPGKSQDWLSKHMAVNKSSVTRHLAKLESEGYIERKSCEEDRRELLVYPTQKMLGIQQEVIEITKEWNKLIADDISPKELEIFHNILDKILEKSQEVIYGGGAE